ncbi:MAG: cobalamin biosynthesis protein CobW [Alphaproteobacteria bacterium]
MNPSRQKIPATVITGFLGAGKTSLIRHLLQSANGRRLALVINEFGSLGIDRDIIDGCGIPNCKDEDVIELANGCICCTVADDFLPTIERLIERDDPPDHIIIETSGLALPKPLVKAFQWPEVRSRVTVDGVVAVVDAAAVADGRFADDPDAIAAQRRDDPSLDHDNPLAEVFDDQIAAADVVLLNKCDLVDAAARDEVTERLRSALRPAAKVLPTTHGVIGTDVLLGLGIGAEDDLATRPSHHDGEIEHDHDDFESFTIALPIIPDPAALCRRIEAAAEAHDVLRVKGFIDVAGKPMRLVIQGVGTRIQHYFDRPWRADEIRRSQLVVIGSKGLDHAAIAAHIGGQHQTP